MTSTLSGLLTLAAAGTASVTVPQSEEGAQSISVQVSSLYAAVAATSGVKATFQVSADGTTFVNATDGPITASAAATVIGTASRKIALEGALKTNTTGSIQAIKMTLTNLDATNAATVAVLSESNFRI
jgi:hypothetical protein